MTDILYIMGHGADGVDNLPLRWSLRSLAKHASNVGRVIVAGHIPKWLSDEVVKFSFDDSNMGSGRQWRILRTEIAAVRGLNLK